MQNRTNRIITIILVLISCIMLFPACSAEKTTDKQNTDISSKSNTKSEMIVLDDGANELSQDNETFSMTLDDNTTLQNCIELSGKNLYWQIRIDNTGSSVIVVEVDGDIHKVEAGETALIYSTGQWEAGTYDVSFASVLPDTMQGEAVCSITESMNEM